VNLPALLGLAFIGIFLILMLIFALRAARQEQRDFREIPAFSRLIHGIGQAVEKGKRVHVSIGWGNIIGPRGPIAFAGLSLLDRITHSTILSDRPPVATAGEGSLAILAQDTVRRIAFDRGGELDPTAGRVTGLTPWSYAAGTLSVVHEEGVEANVLVGSFASEIGLVAEAGERERSFSLAGTDNLTGQAVLFAAAQEPLIGEEAFAGGAYLGLGNMHTASLKVQDLFRWLLIAIILIGTIVKVAGMQ
jgi:hypothetical protein